MMVWPGIPEIALIMALSVAALGQPIVQPPVVEESLSEKVTNPFEPLMKITAENAYSPSLWQARGDENEVKGLFVVPFKAFAAQNLARIKIFFDASASDGTHGLSELQLFDLLLFERRREHLRPALPPCSNRRVSTTETRWLRVPLWAP